MVEASIVVGSIIFGLLIGAIYGVSTVGLNIIFGVLRIVNVGHGAFVMIGAYTTYWLYTLYGLPPYASIPVSLALGFGLGLVMYYAAVRRLVGAPELSSLLATFALGVILQEAVRIAWSPDTRGFTWLVGESQVAGVVVQHSKVVAGISALALAAGVYLLINRTRFGLAVRAVVQDPEGAMVVGINVDRVYALSFALGIAVTVASGSIIAVYLQAGIEPYMGIPYTLKAFVIAVMGGLGSVVGAFVAGILFGLFENATYVILSGIEGVQPLVLTRSAAFALLLLILLLRPQGLFSR